jgi:hypothetical protein
MARIAWALLANGGTYRAPRATGLTKGSLYKASKNKRDLFEKCLDLYMVRDSYKAIFIAHGRSTPDRDIRTYAQFDDRDRQQRRKAPLRLPGNECHPRAGRL